MSRKITSQEHLTPLYREGLLTVLKGDQRMRRLAHLSETPKFEGGAANNQLLAPTPVSTSDGLKRRLLRPRAKCPGDSTSGGVGVGKIPLGQPAIVSAARSGRTMAIIEEYSFVCYIKNLRSS